MGFTETIRHVLGGKDTLDLVDGPIGRNLLFLSLPIVATNLLRTAYNLADTFWVGRISTEALAAIGFAFPVIFFFISLGMGWAVAGSVLVAQFTGASRDEEATYAASQTLMVTIVTAAVLGAIAYVSVGPIVRLLGAEPAVLSLATSYLQIISLGLVPMFGFAIFTALMRGYGDTVTPMVLMLGTVVVNVILDPFLIFGWGPFPELGIEGAAIATVFSRGVAFAVGVAIMLGGRRGVTVVLRQMVPDGTFLLKMLRIGVPAALEGTGRSVSINVVMAIIGTFSTTVVAAYGIGVRILVMVFLPATAVERAVETMTGQNIGAGHQGRARQINTSAAKWLFVALSAVGVVTFVAAEPIIGVFTSNASVIAEGRRFLRIVALTFGFTGVMRAFSGGFRGVGKTLTAALIVFLMLGVIRIPVAWIAANTVGASGVWGALALSNVAGAIIAYALFVRSDWAAGIIRPRDQLQTETAEELLEYTDSIEAG